MTAMHVGLQRRARRASLACASVAAALGAMVLVGWTLDAPALKSVLPSAVSMKANTALGFLLAGLAFWLKEARVGRHERAARLCAALVALLGAATFVEYLLSVDLGIDQLLFVEAPGAVATFAPGRMAPTTAVSFACLGAALLFLDLQVGSVRPAQGLALLVGVASLFAAIGYLYDVEAFYGFARYTRMAVHTSLGFLVLVAAILLARPDQGVMIAFSPGTAAGRLATRVVPAVVLIPIAIGWLRIAGERAGHYDTPFGVALFAAGNVICLTSMAWWAARSLVVSELAHRADQQALAASEQSLATTLDGIGDAVVATDVNGCVTRMNPVAARLTGWRTPEALGKPLGEVFRIVNEETRASVESPVDRVLREGTVVGPANHTVLVAKDATERPIADSGAPIRNEKGEITGVVLVFRDQTGERRATETLRQSEEKYRSLFENAEVAMYRSRLDRSGFVALNQRLADLFGFTKEEMLASPTSLRWADPRARHEMRRLLGEQGELREYPVDILTKSGEVRATLASIKVYPDEGYLEGTVLDVTERQRAERALEESRTFSESLLRTIPFLMDVVDQQGHVLFMNEALRASVGKAARGERCWALYKDDRQQCADCPLKREIESGQTRTIESGGVLGGRIFEIVHTGMTFQGKPALLEIFVDVTEKKQLQAHLAQSDRLSTMGALAAGVAHEINNPLSYVLSNIESLSEDMPKLAAGHLLDPELLDDMVGRVQDALTGTIRIKDIARGLGTFSRVERTDVAPLDLNRSAEHASSMAFNEIKYRARLVKDFGTLPKVLGSDGKLAQVFLNLLINAAHSIGEGRAEHNEIRVRTWADGDDVCAEVSDTGKGIAPEHRARIFEPFFTTKGVGAGTGLGLSICRNIIISLGGEITFTSEVGKTRFLIRLPRMPSDWQAPTDSAQEQASDRPTARGRILVVDDEAAIRQSIGRMLARDHDVILVSSGEEAKAVLENDLRFDIVFCDLMMPGMSGMELHAWLAQRETGLAGRVVFITGGAFTPGAADYLAKVENLRVEKPLDAAEMRRLAQELVRATRTRHHNEPPC